MKIRATLATLLASVVLTAPSLVGGVATAAGYERGPAPTDASIDAAQGPFAWAQTSVANTATPNFGAATIYYPTSTAEGTFGGVAISPGYTERQSAISWLGPRLASHGFVVITFDTNSLYDQPAARGDQLLAALDYLTTTSSVRTRVDASRLAVMGHSMGGGGALEAAKDRPSLKATVPLTPWNTDKTWPEVVSPSLIIGAENDTIAPVASHAVPFYNGMTTVSEKAYLELNDAGHSATNSPNTTTARHSIAWLKRFVDVDTRYSQFICPGPTPSQTGAVSVYSNTCPV
jgi:alpha-beta hydrolase superfamily lysophospholipase